MEKQFRRIAVTLLIILSFLISPVFAGEYSGTELWKKNCGYTISAVGITPDGNYIGSAGQDSVSLYDKNGEKLWDYPVGTRYGISLQNRDPLGPLIAVSGDALRILDVNGKVVRKQDRRYYVYDVVFSRDGNEVIAAYDDNTICYYNISDVATKSTGTAKGSSSSSDEDKDGDGDGDRNISWSSDVGEDLSCIAWTQDKSYIAGATLTGNIYLFDSDGKQIWKFHLPGEHINDISVSDDGNLIATGSNEGLLRVFNRNGKQLWKYQTGRVKGISVSADGSLIASGGDSLYLFERGGEVLWEHKTGKTVSAVSLSQNGSLIAACDERSLYLFSLSDKSVNGGTVTETNTETITKTGTETETDSDSQNIKSTENQQPVAEQSGSPSVAYISLLIVCMIPVIQKSGQK
ncbi:MAG: PQQ-binding-like beta-propeller repeat protein [Euryarchaeota archaeon]|nr:PQQ-binding-like beta-propeller repeat protein [Euryarchaeota archaeon]